VGGGEVLLVLGRSVFRAHPAVMPHNTLLMQVTISASPSNIPVPAAERAALVDLYTATAGSLWTVNTGWRDAGLGRDPCIASPWAGEAVLSSCLSRHECTSAQIAMVSWGAGDWGHTGTRRRQRMQFVGKQQTYLCVCGLHVCDRPLMLSCTRGVAAAPQQQPHWNPAWLAVRLGVAD
jgi:hypothetical protein